MPDLKPLTALGAAAPRVDIIGALTIAETPNVALASLAARKGQGDAVVEVVKAGLALDLPAAGRSVANTSHRIWWTGPEQWMVEADFTVCELLAEALKSIVGATGSVTEQTDGWCRFDVTGDTVVALFERLCAVDVAMMAVGDATRTSMHHIGCFLIRTDEGVIVIGPRASAGSLHHALVEIAGAIA
ncbi:sarcosine oxidase subunit gamma [Thalassobius sp. Cn5-15]|uniref:sarcosine oxidase subunit gamma n=1 Tax=Thalassobius sp. Cn5-15 TaxID=2917763 RepID=UPI001EF36CC2|nr:sarcosine oxidase subunit gamma [Thalassobius sp. Cn5-15]MCG7492364.1 sarcosine oxidase subunit gamma [Thalassobius sp. Cn5-15]